MMKRFDFMTATAREFVRHLLYKSGNYDILYRRRAKKGGSSAHLRVGTLKLRFSTIYDLGVWRVGADTPGSGPGSTLASTAALRKALPSLLNKLNAHTLLDIGCGDFTWMQHVIIDQYYIGMDIVDDVIRQNKQHFHNERRRFLVGDATTDELPEADVILLREILMHLSFADIYVLMRNVLSKDRRYLFITTDRRTMFNSDIPTGDFRLLNLEARPLRFPPPDLVIDDSEISASRIIGVWDAQKLKMRFL